MTIEQITVEIRASMTPTLDEAMKFIRDNDISVITRPHGPLMWASMRKVVGSISFSTGAHADTQGEAIVRSYVNWQKSDAHPK